MTRVQSCSTCRFFGYLDKTSRVFVGVDTEYASLCFRYPPKITSDHVRDDGINRRPSAYGWEWCGEHQPKEPT